MKKTIIVFIVILLTFSGCKKDDKTTDANHYLGTWELIPSTTFIKRDGHMGAATNARGYLGLGKKYNTSDIYLSDWWEFNPADKSLTQKADFTGTSTANEKAFATSDAVYVLDSLKLFKYNPQLNSWTEMNNFPGQLRERFTVAGTSAGAYFGMGIADTIELHDFWNYDESNDHWTEVSSFPGSGSYNASAFIVNDMIYVTNGNYNVSGQGIYTDYNLWAYSPSNNQWTMKASSPEISVGHSFGFSMNGKGYIAGGVLALISQGLREYNPADNSWKSYYDTKFSGGCVFVINNKTYLMQGSIKYVQDQTSADDKFWVLKP